MTAGCVSRASQRGRHIGFQAGVDKPAARDIFDDICTSLDCNAGVGA